MPVFDIIYRHVESDIVRAKEFAVENNAVTKRVEIISNRGKCSADASIST
jgi:hypothetical protein